MEKTFSMNTITLNKEFSLKGFIGLKPNQEVIFKCGGGDGALEAKIIINPSGRGFFFRPIVIPAYQILTVSSSDELKEENIVYSPKINLDAADTILGWHFRGGFYSKCYMEKFANIIVYDNDNDFSYWMAFMLKDQYVIGPMVSREEYDDLLCNSKYSVVSLCKDPLPESCHLRIIEGKLVGVPPKV